MSKLRLAEKRGKKSTWDGTIGPQIRGQYCSTEARSIHKGDGRARRRQGSSARAVRTERGGAGPNGAGERAANGAGTERGGVGSERHRGADSERRRGMDSERRRGADSERRQLTARGANSERRGGVCSEHEHRGRAANSAEACAASTSAGVRDRTARESGQRMARAPSVEGRQQTAQGRGQQTARANGAGGRTANGAGARAASTSTGSGQRMARRCVQRARARKAGSEWHGGACSEHERGGQTGERAVNSAGTEREGRAANGAGARTANGASERCEGRTTARGVNSEWRGGACSEHEHGERAVNGAGARAASTSAGSGQRMAQESGQGRCMNEVENQGSLSKKKTVFIRDMVWRKGASAAAMLQRREPIEAKNLRCWWEQERYHSGKATEQAGGLVAGVVEDGSKARWCVMGTNYYPVWSGCGAPSIEAGGGANGGRPKNQAERVVSCRGRE
ncbi:hypothetical protein B0H14DRAFT_3151405 [Mycena olivaceomarginata]|nr:hypothetical protein B0H14DRAFT_3151405 [Mycena olivaceomarginata]